jgi:hypothetical protein
MTKLSVLSVVVALSATLFLAADSAYAGGGGNTESRRARPACGRARPLSAATAD